MSHVNINNVKYQTFHKIGTCTAAFLLLLFFVLLSISFANTDTSKLSVKTIYFDSTLAVSSTHPKDSKDEKTYLLFTPMSGKALYVHMVGIAVISLLLLIFIVILHCFRKKYKIANDILQKYYHLFSTFFHNSPLHSVLFRLVRNEQGEIVDWIFEEVNALGEKTVGMIASEVKGRSVYEIFDNELITPYLERLKELDSTEKPQQFSTYFPVDGRHYYTSFFLLGNDLCAATSIDISEQIKEEEVSRKAKEMLKQALEKAEMVSRQMESAREDERKLIAHEIHDELGQMLVALQMDLHWIRMQVDEREERIKAKLDEMISISSNLISEIQRITSHLSPQILADLGINEALEWLVSDFSKRSPIRYEFTSFNADHCSLPQCSTAVFRIAQAALTNVVRHSQATQVDITLTCGRDRALLEITDNGIGISEDKISALDSMGLIGMRERARLCGGTLTISGNKGNGTRIIASIPCSGKREK